MSSSVTFLFWNGGSLSEEWLATAAGIAITFFVFIMGVPAFVLQTFIAGNLRDVYYERIGNNWPWFFGAAIIFILVIFFAGNVALDERVWQFLGGKNTSDAYSYIPWVVTGCLILLIGLGFLYLWTHFISARSIEKRLSERLVKDAQKHYRKGKTKELDHDLELLSIMASEVRGGTPKKYFLEQCEVLIEYLIQGTTEPQKRPGRLRSSSVHWYLSGWLPPKRAHRQPTKPQSPYALLRRILQEVVTPSVAGGREKVSSENRKQALDLLAHTYNKARRNGDHSYLVVTIGHGMLEIGLAALKHKDHPALMDAVEKMAEIQGRYKEMFIVATAAFWENQVKPAIAAARKLEAVLRASVFAEEAEQRKSSEEAEQRKYATYYWLGLLANLYAKEGAARAFAKRQLDKFEPLLTRDTFDSACDYFANRMAYFDTADSVHRLKDERFPPSATVRRPLTRSK